jgi:hypothetical protein
MSSLRGTAFKDKVDVVVSCLASRTGGIKDSWDIDYQATLNALEAGRAQGAAHFVLLSAICVQKPLLEFQRAKLALEAKLQEAAKEGGITHSIVRPTAFFKSLAGQVRVCLWGLCMHGLFARLVCLACLQLVRAGVVVASPLFTMCLCLSVRYMVVPSFTLHRKWRRFGKGGGPGTKGSPQPISLALMPPFFPPCLPATPTG